MWSCTDRSHCLLCSARAVPRVVCPESQARVTISITRVTMSRVTMSRVTISITIIFVKQYKKVKETRVSINRTSFVLKNREEKTRRKNLSALTSLAGKKLKR